MSTITIVGCGMMGSAIAKTWIEAGHSLVVVDLNKKAAEVLIQKGAAYSETLSKAPDTEFIFFNLPDNAITKKILDTCEADQIKGKTIINSTTSTPQTVKAIEESVQSKGALYLDCKITAYPTDIGTDKGNILYSGNKEAYEKAEPILNALSKVVYLGENTVASAIIDMANVGTYFNVVVSMIQSAALCIQNGVSAEEFVTQVQEALPVYTSGIFDQIKTNLAPYDGEFVNAVYSTLNNEISSIDTTIQSFAESNILTSNLEVARELIYSANAKGYGDKDLIATITDMIKDQPEK